MTGIWIIFTIGVSAFLTERRICVKAQSDSRKEDLYLPDLLSGENPQGDDDDGGDDDDSGVFSSGSGFGVDENVKVTVRTVYVNPSTEPTQRTFKAQGEMFPRWKHFEAETPALETEDSLERSGVTAPVNTPSLNGAEENVSSESLFQRSAVLAAVIVGGVIGFIFAVFLILLLVYRMRKKDEGSYTLGERKSASSAYQSASTKEFYA